MIDKPTKFKANDNLKVGGNLPFYGDSSYKAEFKPSPMDGRSRTPNLRNTSDNINFGPPLNTTSHYQDQFKPFEIQRKPVCPINTLPPYPRNRTPDRPHIRYNDENQGWD